MDLQRRKRSGTSPSMLHRVGELVSRKGVQHVVSGQPSAAGLQDAKADLLHVRSVVGVRVDYDLHAMSLGLSQIDVVEIESVGVGIQFHCDFILRSS